MSINVKKTTYIIFTSGRNRIKNVHNIVISGETVKQVESVKFLGVILDSKLSWSEHISFVRCKISKGIGIMCKARKYLSISTLVTLYYCFIYPYITYCVEVWGGANITLLSSIIKLQKCVIRIIVSAPFRAHTSEIFEKLKILPIHKVYKYYVILFMYKFQINKLPAIFNKMFSHNYEIHSYHTRQHKKLNVPIIKSTAYKKTMKYIGVSLHLYL